MPVSLAQLFAWIATDSENYAVFLQDPEQIAARYLNPADAALVCAGSSSSIHARLALEESGIPIPDGVIAPGLTGADAMLHSHRQSAAEIWASALFAERR